MIFLTGSVIDQWSEPFSPEECLGRSDPPTNTTRTNSNFGKIYFFVVATLQEQKVV